MEPSDSSLNINSLSSCFTLPRLGIWWLTLALLLAMRGTEFLWDQEKAVETGGVGLGFEIQAS